MVIILTLYIVGSFLSSAAQAAGVSAQETTPNEERLVQKIKAEVLQDLKQGDWLAQQIELGIEKYILKLQQAQEAEHAEQERLANEKAKQVRHVSRTRDHIRGNPEAAISLIEYSDLECSFCKQFHSTATQLVETSAGTVNWVYRHFPLPFHTGALQKAEATECASALGGNSAFWAYTDAIFARTTSNGNGYPKERLVPLAKELGLDRHKFKTCVESGRHAARVKEDMTEAEQIGVASAPTNILLNNKTGEVRILIGAMPSADLKKAIAQLLGENDHQGKRD